MPTSMTTPEVTVIMPNGSTMIPNPLYAYRFHPVSMGDFYYEPVSTEDYTKASVTRKLTVA